MKSPDPNVEHLREMLLQRSQVGLKKYGCTTADNPLELEQWLQHALEETLDKAVYLQAAIVKVRANKESVNSLADTLKRGADEIAARLKKQ